MIPAGTGARIPASESEFAVKMLASAHNVGGFEYYLVESEPSGVRLSGPHPRGVIEHIHIFSGQVKITLPGRSVVLNPGDYCNFKADVEHSYQTLESGTRGGMIMQYA